MNRRGFLRAVGGGKGKGQEGDTDHHWAEAEEPGQWDSHKVHDPGILVRDGWPIGCTMHVSVDRVVASGYKGTGRVQAGSLVVRG